MLKEAAIPEPCFTRDVPKEDSHKNVSQKGNKQINKTHTSKSAGPDDIHTQVLEKLKCEKVK